MADYIANFWRSRTSSTTNSKRPEPATDVERARTGCHTEAEKSPEVATVEPLASEPVARPSTAESEVKERSLADIAEDLRRCYAVVLRNREEVGKERLEVQAALQRATQLRDCARESQRGLMSYIRDQGGGDTFDRARLVSLYNAAIADSNAVDAQAMIAKVIEGKLSSKEYRMREYEYVFSRHLTQFLMKTGVWESAQLDRPYLLESLLAISTASMSPAQDPLLENYYNKAGEIGLLGEEIANLDIDFQQAASLRELKSDQGNAPSQSESQYEQEYRTSRSEIEKRLGDAIEAAEDAKRKCVMANLDPELLISDMPIDELALPDPLPMPPIAAQHIDRVEPLNEQHIESVSPTAGRKQELVLEWASGIATVSEETTTVSRHEVNAMPDFQEKLEKTGYQAVQYPRRRSSVSHLRYHGDEAIKHI